MIYITAQNKRYTVKLSEKEQQEVESLVKKGISSARVHTRARILLLTNSGKKDREICFAFGINRSVVHDVRKHYVEGGIKRALYDLPRPGQKRTLSGQQEAQVIAIACSDAPKGYVRWTLDLLVTEVKKKIGVSIGRTAIWHVLLRSDTKPWLKKNVVYP